MRKRLLSIVLCLIMILGMFPTGVLADDVQAETPPEYVDAQDPGEDLTAGGEEPDAPEVEVPDVPKVEVPDVPEVEEPDTPGDEEPDAPEDEEPDAPDGEVPDTPEGEASGAPEDEGGDTPESEERVYTFTDGTVTVETRVQPEAGLSPDAQLHAEKLERNSNAYREAYEKALGAVELPENAILEFVPYDVFFEDGGARVEPAEGTVRVTMRFAGPVFEAREQQRLIATIDVNTAAETEPALEEGPIFAIHIVAGDEVQQLENRAEGAEAEDVLIFDLDSFSIMGPARISTVMPLAAGEGLYGYLYSDGEFVITDSAAPEAGRTVTNTYSDIGSTGYTKYSEVPWYNQRTGIKTVTFKAAEAGGKVQPASMAYWFYGCTALTAVDFNGLDTGLLTSLASTFYNCSSLTAMDLSGWELPALTTYGYMFYGCSSLTNVDMSGWKLSALSGTQTGVFYSCSKLTEVDMSGWKLTGAAAFSPSSSTTISYRYFGSCSVLASVDMSGWVTAGMSAGTSVNLQYMFYSCTKLTDVDLSGWDSYERISSLNYSFYNCSALTALDASDWKLTSLKTMNYAFYGCSGLTALDTSGWGLDALTSMTYAFYNCSALTALDVSGWKLSALTNMSYAFYGCSGLTALDASGWTLSAVTNMSYAFYNCSGLTALDAAGWGLDALTNMSYAFYGCSSLEELDASGWTLSALTNMAYAFYSCHSLTELNAENWNTQRVTDMTNAFNPGPERLVLGPDFVFKGSGNALGPSVWRLENDSSKVYTHEELFSGYSGETMSGVYVRTDESMPGGWVWVILYSDNELVFQHSREPEAGRDITGGPWQVNTSQAHTTSTLPWYTYRASVTKITFKDLIQPVNMDYWFAAMTNSSLDNRAVYAAENLDTHYLTSMSHTFYDDGYGSGSQWRDINLRAWDLENVQNMSYTFCSPHTSTSTRSIDLGSNTLSNVTNMTHFLDLGYTSQSGVAGNSLTYVNSASWDLRNVVDMSYAFYNCYVLEELPGSWNLTRVQNMYNAFRSCRALKSLDVSSWHMENVTNMQEMFFGCSALETLDTSNWVLSSVTNMSKAFNSCSSLKALPGNWKLSAITDTGIANAFNGCRQLSVLNTSSWDLSRVTSIENLFYNCSKLTNLDTKNWKLFASATGSSFNMNNAFFGTGGLAVIDASTWNNSKMTSNMTKTFWPAPRKLILGTNFKFIASGTPISAATYQRESNKAIYTSQELYTSYVGSTMADTYYIYSYDPSGYFYVLLYDDGELVFQYTSEPEEGRTLVDWYQINVSVKPTGTSAIPWYGDCARVRTVTFKDPIQPIYMDYWFYGCTNLDGRCFADAPMLDTSLTQSMSYLFYGCAGMTALEIGGWDVSAVTSLASTFYGCTGLRTLDLNGWDVGAVTSMASTFYNCSALTELAVDAWRPARVTSFEKTFYGCSALPVLDVGDWVLNAATNISYMFYGCTNLFRIGADSWGLNSVTNASYAFQNCKGLYDMDTSGWVMPKATTITYMFSGCSSLTDLKAGGWDLGSVTTAAYAFSGCTSLVTLGDGSWNLTKPTNLTSLFYNCNSLIELDVSNWNSQAVTTTASSVGSLPSLWKVTLWRDPNGTKNILSLGDEKTQWFEENHPEEEDYTFTPNQMRSRNQQADTAGRTYYRICRVTFDPMGGTIEGNRFVDGWYAGTAVEKLPSASRRGYDFDGWYTRAVGGEKIEDGEPLWQTTFYAHWKEHSYTLVLNSNDNTNTTKSFTLKYSEFFSLSPEYFTWEFHELTGWNTSADGTGTPYGPNETVLQLTGDDGGTVNLFAQWEDMSNMVTVTFDVDGGVAVAPIQVRRDTPIGKLPITAKDGYTFMGWRMTDRFGDIVDENTVIRGNVTLFAEFQIHRVVRFYLNRYNVQDAEPTVTRKVPYDTAVGALPTDPANGSYGALIGWFTQPDGGEQVTSATRITKDTDLYGQWGWRPKFNANGGRITKSPDLAISKDPVYTVTQFPEVEYDGYKLVGWTLSDGVTEVHEGSVIDLSEGAEIVAVWERDNTVKLQLNPSGGTLKGSTRNYTLEVYANVPVTELPTPTRTGYEFLGWLDTSNPNGGYCDRNTVFTQDTMLQAQWAQKSVTITFDRNNTNAQFPGLSTTTATKTVSVPYNGTLDTLPGCNAKANSSLTGWYLCGWYPNPDGTGDVLTTNTVLTENATYYAKWDLLRKTEKSDLHQYTYGAYWTTASSTHVDNTGLDIQFHPTTDTEQVAQLHVYFQLDDVKGGVDALPPGSVQIKVPKHIFTGWDGEYVDTCDISKQLTVYPKEGVTAFSYIDDENADYYLLVNTKSILATQGFEIDINYTVLPSKVPGGATNKDGRYVEERDASDELKYKYFDETVTVDFYIDETPDPQNPAIPADPDSHAWVDLHAEMHTQVDTNATKSFSSFVYNWESTWGPKPVDADDYFYIRWTLSESYTSKTNQPSTFQWTEDVTVHDGTVVYISPARGSNGGQATSTPNTCTVVTKHPISLMQNIPATGRTFYNEAIVTETWKSGYITENRVSATAVMYDSDYPDGDFDKVHDNNLTISGGQEDVLEYQTEVSMPWRLTYDGGSNARPAWNETTGTYSAARRTICIQDGVSGDLMYSSGRAAAKYIWEPNTGNTVLEDGDYYFTTLRFSLTEYDARYEGGTWTQKLPNYNTELYDTIDVYVRYKNKTEFELYTQLKYSENTSVTLPPDTAGFEVRHNSEFYWTRLVITAGMMLVPTQKVQSLVQEDVNFGCTSIFKNIARCDIWLDGEVGQGESPFFHATNYAGSNQDAQKQEYELTRSDTRLYVHKYAASKTNTERDPATGLQTTVMHLSAFTYNTASGRYTRMTSGVLYDLLPYGNTVDPASVICLYKTNTSSTTNYTKANSYNSYVNSPSRLREPLVDVRFEENWNDTGRTMMIIKYYIDESLIPAGSIPDGIDVLYKMCNDDVNIRENSTTVENDLAFINTTPNHPLPTSTSGSITTIAPDAQDSYMDLLRQYNGDIGFAKASTAYITPTAFSWDFSKTVQTEQANGFVRADETLPGNTYTYRLMFGQSNTARNHDIVFYDVLENGIVRREGDGDTDMEEKPSQWQGIFQSVSVTVVDNSREKQPGEGPAPDECNPVVYYSTADQSLFVLTPEERDNPRENAEYYNLKRSDIWSTEPPADLSTVTAIAVDCTKSFDEKDFTLLGQSWIRVDITLRAPVDKTVYPEDFSACNEAMACAFQEDAGRSTVQYSDAEVTLRDVDPGIKKESDPPSGTSTDPAEVKQKTYVNYNISVKNVDDSLTMYDIVVEDTLPDGMYFSAEDILVYFDSDPNLKVKIALSPRAGVVRSGQHLRFTISSLKAKETIHFVVPALVVASSATFENTAEITEVNGLEKTVRSETTYHEVVPTYNLYLMAHKTLSGNRWNQIGTNEFMFKLELLSIDGEEPPADLIYEDIKGTRDASGLVDFEMITYDTYSILGWENGNKESVYLYSITELSGNDQNIDYDTEPVYAKVTVKLDDTEGDLNKQIKADVKYYRIVDGQQVPVTTLPDMGNHYNATGEVILEAKKTLTGRGAELAEDEFRFTAVLVDSRTHEPITGSDARELSSYLGSDGKVVFDPLELTEEDIGRTYTYRLTEIKGSVGGVTYSDQVYYAEIKIADNLNADASDDSNSTGKLAITVSYFQIDADGYRQVVETPEFKNVYEAEGLGQIGGSKIMFGRTLAEGEFTFDVVDAAGNVIASAINDADGNFIVENIGKWSDDGVLPFTLADLTGEDGPLEGYKLVEHIPAEHEREENVAYDETEYPLLITVADNNYDGTLDVTITTEDGADVTFKNAYLQTVDVDLTAHKTLEGATLAAGLFRFALLDEEGAVLQTVANSDDGSVQFQPLEYTSYDEGKTFTYTVVELSENGHEGVTYDETVYTVTVRIVMDDEAEDTIKAITTIQGPDPDDPDGTVEVDAMTFSNSFSGSVTLHKVDKNGKSLSGAQFRLYMWDADGKDWRVYDADSEDGLYTVDERGLLTVDGLMEGKYYFVETRAPDGYSIAAGADGSPRHYPFIIGIDAAGGSAKAAVTLRVENTPNSTPPPEKPAQTPGGGHSPSTGDASHPGLWMLLLAVCAAGMPCMLFAGKKKRRRG